MLEQFLITKEEVYTAKVGLKNPLGLNTEKISQTPRVFNTHQIKSAAENILLLETEGKTIPHFLLSISEYLLKDFFLYMHQTGLYNRQFNLWRTLANITQISFLRLKKGLIKKQDINSWMINFFIDPSNPCICTIVSENEKNTFLDFKTCLQAALVLNNAKRLKGIFYFLRVCPESDFLSQLNEITDTSDPVSKYESIISKIKEVRLNIISYRNENESYTYKHIFPEIKQTEVKK